ncbi:MAG: protoporphyrinogen oxidase HemJ [Helicobacteraceae bacterium]|jgi:putative membrane protein|nr:protoporphyrinogen oxidase HemJ [Helicobacteraceae bacterium]
MEILALKALHIMAVISWFAAMFYMPRLFVYHAENIENKDFVRVVKIQELKLWKYIALPAFWAALASGLMIIFTEYGFSLFKSGGWMHVKLTLVALLIAWFFHMGYTRKQLEADKCQKSGKFFRFYNEIPTLFMIPIVILVIFKNALF